MRSQLSSESNREQLRSRFSPPNHAREKNRSVATNGVVATGRTVEDVGRRIGRLGYSLRMAFTPLERASIYRGQTEYQPLQPSVRLRTRYPGFDQWEVEFQFEP